MTRCSQCHASIPVPAALDAVTFRCEHCGLVQQVPDLPARRQMLLAEQREQREREKDQREHERELRKEEREAEDRKAEQRAKPFKWVARLIPMLIAPVIIAITVFDAPARLGFGASGSDRLAQYVAQAKTQGCTVLRPIEAEYANSTVSKLISVGENQCIRAIAAGGPGHSELTLKLFASYSAAGVPSPTTLDPQLEYCATSADTMRLEVGIGPAAKGRLSTVVLACPGAKQAPTPAKKPQR